jgi:hypothetical protein
MFQQALTNQRKGQPLKTDCTAQRFNFQANGRRQVTARFDGGTLCSDGGALLLREVERRRGILRRLAACFTDLRDPRLVEHQVEELVSQGVYGIATGYEDLCNHE